MKSASLVLLIGLTAFAAPAGAITVVDVGMNTQTRTNQLANMAKYAEMVAQYKQQLDQMQQQYKSLTGTRNLGEILNNPAFRNYLPPEWQDVYRSVQNGGYSGLTGAAKAIRDLNQVYDACATRTGRGKTICERAASKAAQDKAFATEAFDRARDRLDQITGLMKQVNATSDPKAIAEIQARIAVEQAAIQNEQTKLQMYQMIANAEDRLVEQQQREEAAAHFDKITYAKPEPFF